MIRLFRVFIPVSSITLLLSEALWIAASFIVACYLVLPVDPTDYLLNDGGLIRISAILLGILLGLHFQDLYSKIRVKSRILLAQQLCLAMGVAFLLQGLLTYVNIELRLPIRVMAAGTLLSILVIFCWRLIFSAYAARVMGRERLLLVGSSPVLADIARHLDEHPDQGMVVIGFVDDARNMESPSSAAKVLGPIAAVREIVEATRPDRVVVGMSERRSRVPVNDLLDLRFGGQVIEEAAATYERVLSRVCVKELRPSQLIYSGELGPSRPTVMTYQRIAHAVIAGIAIVATVPLMLFSIVVLWLTSAGPVISRQQRVGLNGTPFTLYRFRLARPGGLLRQLGLDGLPQLFNVLAGNMAIVGPRPERPEFVKELGEQIPYYRQRHSVRPGLTGWAQINYEHESTREDVITNLEYDLYYIKNMSMGLDTYIIFHTIKAMLLSRR